MILSANGRIGLPKYVLDLFWEKQEVCVCREYKTNYIYISREKPEITYDDNGNQITDMLLGVYKIGSQGRFVLPKSALKTLGIKEKNSVSLEALRFMHQKSLVEDYKVYIKLIK